MTSSVPPEGRRVGSLLWALRRRLAVATVCVVQTEIDLNLFLSGSFSPELAVNTRQRYVWLRVFLIQPYRLQLFLDSSVELTSLLKDVAQTVVGHRNLSIKPESFAQIGFGFLRPP